MVAIDSDAISFEGEESYLESEAESDFEDLENIAPSNKLKKTTKVASKTVMKKASPKKKSPKRSKKTVEQMYQKKTQLEHILLRPDTYGALFTEL